MLKILMTSGLCAAAVLTAAAPADAATCGTLPGQVQGNPNVKPGQAAAAYLWHDSQGWKLRVTHPGTTRMVVTGTITATRSITHLSVFHLERGDAVAVSSDGHTLSFRMTNIGHLDGVGFTAECSKTLRVNVRVNAHEATTKQVFLGSHRMHPTSVPFAIQRS
jgi:hypothetical protein